VILVINAFIWFSNMLSFIVPLSGAKLQLVQNFACRIVLGLRNYDHITGGRNSLADGLGRLV
jgi:hypothetical protein